MKELLEKLKQLDPATHASIMKWSLNWNHPDEVALSEYIIQGEVQRAVVTRRNDDVRWRVQVEIGARASVAIDIFRRGEGRIFGWVDYADSPAKALLSTYIVCLEATA